MREKNVLFFKKLFKPSSGATLLLLIYLLSGCTNPGTTSTQGPIQLYDLHGKLICQIHGQDQQLNCLGQNATQGPFASHFIAYAVNELASDLHVSVANLPTSGLKVTTTLDLDLQKQVLQNTKRYISTMAKSHKMSDAAVVILDYHNGAIRSLFGNLDNVVTDTRANVATQNVRQVGSVFKPFVYATAFDLGISPGEVVYDGKFSVGKPAYTPNNYDGTYHGYMSYRSALQKNLNIPALKLYLKIGGFDTLAKKTPGLGIKMDERFRAAYSLPLGPVEYSLLDVTTAYGTMANGGIHIPPHAIETISASDGHVLYQAQAKGTHALSPGAAFMITDVLSDGTAHAGACSPYQLYTATAAQCRAGNPGSIRPTAVIGGLSETFRDTMAIGYTTDLVAGTLAGNSDYSLMADVTSNDGAGQIWHDAMLLAEGNMPIKQFPSPPADVVKKTVNYGNLTTTDWYLAGH